MSYPHVLNVQNPTPTPTSSPDLTLPFKSPLTITGKIDRSWVFEGSFPVKLYDDQNKILFQTTGLAPHWTEGSGQFVDFTADLRFSTTAKTGFLVISNDNPSGLPQNSKSIKFPVIFSNSSTIDTSSWKNYSNQEFGVSFLYPKDWKIVYDSQPNNGHAQLYVNSGNNILISLIKSNENTTSSCVFTNLWNGDITNTSQKSGTYSEISSSNHDRRIMWDEYYGKWYLCLKGKNGAYSMNMPFNGKVEIDTASKEILQILSTFKFTQ